MSISKTYDISLWLKKRRKDWAALTPEARSFKRVRGRERSFEEKQALVLAGKRAWDDWILTGKIKKTDEGYELCKV